MKELLIIQEKLNAPKTLRNNFGNYNYRSAETILEAVKPLLKETKCTLTLSDEIVNLGNRFYIKAIAQLKNEEGLIVYTTGYAREEETKKGMDGSQITGASSSYARKYALNGLFAIDDEKDSDATNTHGKEENKDTGTKKWYNDVDKNIDIWHDLVADGETTPQAIIDKIESQGYTINKANKEKILNLK